jgi:hypothetical protein
MFYKRTVTYYGDDYIISGTTLTIDDERPAPETFELLGCLVVLVF